MAHPFQYAQAAQDCAMYRDSVESLESQIGSLNEEYQAVKEAVDHFTDSQKKGADSTGDIEVSAKNLVDQIRELNESYQTAYNEAVESVQGQFGLWDQLGDKVYKNGKIVSGSLEDIRKGMDQQTGYWTSYTDNLTNLLDRNVDGLSELLSQMNLNSTDGAKYLAAMAGASDQELSSMIEDYQNLKTAQGEAAAVLSDLQAGYTDAVDAMANAASDGAAEMDASEDAKQSAQNTIQGYINGISANTPAMTKAMRRAAERALAAWKAGLDEHSPSRKMYESGSNSIQGYVNAIQDRETELGDVMKRAAELAAESFADNTDAQQLAEELADAYQATLAAMAEEGTSYAQQIQEQMETVEDAMDNMAEKLAGYGDLTSTYTIKWSDGSSYSEERLADLQSQVDAINAYGEALEALKARGASDSLMDQVLSMDVDEATQYANLLLGQSDEEWEQYLTLWDEKQRRSREIAQSYYQPELDTLETEFSAKLADGLGGLKDESFQAGLDTMEGLLSGLENKESDLYAKAESIANRITATIRSALDMHSPSRVGKEIGSNFVGSIGLGIQEEAPTMAAMTAAAVPTQLVEAATPEPGAAQTAAVVNAISTLTTGMDSGIGGGDLTIVMKLDEIELGRALLPGFRSASAQTPEVDVDIS